MTGEKKLFIGIIMVTVVALVGAIFFLTKSAPSKPNLVKTVGAKIETPETNFDFKDIPYSGGYAIHEFKIKNAGDKELQIANLKTSCSCTQTYLKTAKGDGPQFSMHSGSSWIGKLAPGEEAVIVSDFDPAFHGPSGVGPISRIVSFETNDPDKPYVELTFSGNVVK